MVEWVKWQSMVAVTTQAHEGIETIATRKLTKQQRVTTRIETFIHSGSTSEYVVTTQAHEGIDIDTFLPQL